MRLTGRHRLGRYEMEVLTQRFTPFGYEVYIQAWKDGRPLGFGPGGVYETERIHGHGVITEKEGLERLWRTVLKIASAGDNIVPGTVGNSAFTGSPNSGTGSSPVDGQTSRTGVTEDWSTIRDAVGNSSTVTAVAANSRVITSATTDSYQRLDRAVLCFDTSSIPNAAFISGGDIDLYTPFGGQDTLVGGGSQVMIAGVSPLTDDTTVSDADYQKAVFTQMSDRHTVATLPNPGTTTYTLNLAGRNWVNKGGLTRYMLLNNYEVDNVEPNWTAGGLQARCEIYTADNGSDIPVLTVQYNVPVYSEATLTLGGGSVTLGDGVSRVRRLNIPAAEFGTPFWITPDGNTAKAQRVDSLPATVIVDAGVISASSSEP